LKSALWSAALALGICMVLVAAGWQDRARAEDQQTPTPEPGTTGQESCIGQTEGYETHGRVVTYVITLSNKCDKRMRCEVFAYLTSAKGPALGHGVLRLGPKSSGANATRTYTMRTRMAGGSAQLARECRVY
jgi:hypothetical protein